MLGANKAYGGDLTPEQGGWTEVNVDMPSGETRSVSTSSTLDSFSDNEMDQISQSLSAAMSPKIEQKDGGFKEYALGGLDESKLDIISPQSDPWEYSKTNDGKVITRKKALGDTTAGSWIEAIEGSTAHTAIVDTILKPTAIHYTSTDKQNICKLFSQENK